jgi:ACR3 family arsenite efflux pump ArsB
MKVDLAAIGGVREHWRGIDVTLFVNWAIKLFSMAVLGWFGASNFFELAVAAAISISGFSAGAALATLVGVLIDMGVLIEVPVMLALVKIVNDSKRC